MVRSLSGMAVLSVFATYKPIFGAEVLGIAVSIMRKLGPVTEYFLNIPLICHKIHMP